MVRRYAARVYRPGHRGYQSLPLAGGQWACNGPLAEAVESKTCGSPDVKRNPGRCSGPECKCRSGVGRRRARLGCGANEAGRWCCRGRWKNFGARVGCRQNIRRRRRQRKMASVSQAEGAMLEPHAFVLPGTGHRLGRRRGLRADNRADISPRHRRLRRRQSSRHARRERRQQNRENRDPGGEAASAVSELHHKCCEKINAYARPAPCLP